MIICPLCGNCTGNKSCEVCGMDLFTDENSNKSMNGYENPEQQYRSAGRLKTFKYYFKNSGSP